MSLTKTVTVKSPQSSLWGVTAFFNPQHYLRRSKQQGLRLLTVELAFNDAPFELHRREAEILIQLRCGENSVMWQKERLLNIGLNHLPPECTSLVWLDCDVVFENPNWIRETAYLLQRYKVVQPFSISVRLPHRKDPADLSDAENQTFERMPSAGYSYTHPCPFIDCMLNGHTGFAWAAQRSLFDGIGFYDKMIVGGGDAVLACGIFGRKAHKFTHLLPAPLVADQQAWIAAVSSRVAGSITFTKGRLLHLWHGHPRRRMTLARLQLLVNHGFDPRSDLGPSPRRVLCLERNEARSATVDCALLLDTQ